MYVSDRCLLVKSYDTCVLSTRQHNTSTNNVHSTTCLSVVILGSLYMCCYDCVVMISLCFMYHWALCGAVVLMYLNR